MMRRMKRLIRTGLIAGIIAFIMAGCALDHSRGRHHRTSLLDYLYPDGREVQMTPQVPTLKLPLRVGLAWVPATDGRNEWRESDQLPETVLAGIAEKVARQFTNRPFVSEVVVIPSAYVQARGGFHNLDQIQSAFGVDVIALMSRDQKQFNDANELTFLYWTVVGLYTVPAELNETFTMVDTAVFDIPSRTLLFRAPGTSRLKTHTTAIRVDANLRQQQETGLDKAAVDMVANLDKELTAFQGRVKEGRQSVKIEHRPGYTGAGAGGWADVGILAGLAGAAVVFLRRPRPTGTVGPSNPPQR